MTNFSQKTPFNLAEFLSKPATPVKKRANPWVKKSKPSQEGAAVPHAAETKIA